MKTLEELLFDYTRGEKTLEETNQALKELGSTLRLDPSRNLFSAQELMETRVGETPDEANGWGILDHGVGCMEKVRVVGGRTVDVDMGQETAFVYMAGRRYRCYIACYDAGHQALGFDAEARKPVFLGSKCVGCHLCATVCHVNCISKAKRVAKKH